MAAEEGKEKYGKGFMGGGDRKSIGKNRWRSRAKASSYYVVSYRGKKN